MQLRRPDPPELNESKVPAADGFSRPRNDRDMCRTGNGIMLPRREGRGIEALRQVADDVTHRIDKDVGLGVAGVDAKSELSRNDVHS